MPKKFLIAPLLALVFSVPLFPQGENVVLLGRWAKGQSTALFRRGGFTFVGNGTYLEVYKKRVSVYEKLDEIILSGPVHDIFVQESNLHHVYVACGESGMDVVYFDYENPLASAMLDTVIGRYDSDGFASGIAHSGSHVYLADGSGGMKIIYVGVPSQPQYRSTFQTSGFAQDVWIAGNTAYVAADQSGVYSISIADPLNPTVQDTLQFAKVFPEKSKPAALKIIAVGTKAYVAAGWGGMRILDISVPSAMHELGTWTQGGIPRNVIGVWVNANFAYVACGADGLVSHIDITNPAAPSIPLYSPLNTDGITSSVIVSNDTAYVADGANGHLVVDVGIAAPPSILRRFGASGATRDVDLSGSYAYTATGESGLRIFNTAITSPPQNRLEEIGSCETPGEALSVRKSGNYAYVADGSKGLAILNVSNPFSIVLETQVDADGDSCRDADVSGNFAYLACGSGGLRIFNNIHASPFEVAASPATRMGFARSVRVSGERVFVAHSRGVTVFSATGLPQNLSPLDSLTSQMDARGVAVSGDTVFVANGERGFAVWNLATDQVQHVNTEGFCSDIAVRNKSVYVADGRNGFAIYNISSLDNIVKVAYYETGGDARSLAVSNTGQRVVLADVQNGIHVLSNDIAPMITVDPGHLDFGPVPLGYSRPLKLKVGNPGTAELRVTQIKLAGNSNAFRFSATSFTVPPGKSIPLTVWFEPRLPYPTEPIDHVVSAAVYSNADTLGMTLQGEATTLNVEGPYRSDPFTIGLWHLDEGDGVVVAADASPRGLNGDVSGNPARVASREGYTRAVRFDGSNDWIRIPYNSIFNLTTVPFTVETWLNIAKKPAASAVLIARGNGNTSQFELGLSAQEDGGIVGKVWDNQGLERRVHSGSLQDLNENQWYHAALTWDTDTLRLLVNGFEEDQAAFSGPLRNQTSEPVSIGSNSLLSSPFNGIMDEVRISGIARQPWEFHVNQSRITVSSLALDFGTVLMGKKRNLLLTVGNAGAQPLTLTSISGSHESLSALPKTPLSLSPGRDTTVTVTFQPTVEVDLEENGTLVLSSSDPTYPNRIIRLKGRGVRNIPAGSYDTDPFTAGLWHFDQPGSVVVDSSGLGLNGRLYNGALISNEIRKFDTGYAASFDGKNDACVIPLSAHPFGPDWGGLTVEAWIYPKELPDGKGVLLRRGGPQSFQFNVYLDSTGTLYGQVQNSQGAIYTVNSKSKDPLGAQKWVHVALTADEDSIALFVNGQRYGSRSFAGGIKSGTTDVDTLALYLANAVEGNRGFSGCMDEVRISTIKRQAWEFNVNDVRMELSSAQLNFGEVLEGSTRTLKILFRNIGSDILEVKSLQSSDPDLFRIDTTWFRLYPDSSLFVSVTYAPAAEGYHLGQMTIQSNDPFWPVRAVILQGQAIEISSIGQYVADVYTVNLVHFDPGTEHFDFEGREVSWSDSGRFGDALRFGGGWINFPVGQTIDLFSTPLTLECWFSMDRKPDTTATLMRWGRSGQGIVDISFVKGGGKGIQISLWDVFGQRLEFTGVTLDRLSLYSWYQLALTWDGDTLRFYLNRELLVKRKFEAQMVLSSQVPFFIGAADSLGRNPFMGSVDEVRISNVNREPWEFNVLPPKIWISATSLNFSAVMEGQVRTLELLVKNYGDQDLSITQIYTSNPVFTSDPPAGFDLSRFQSRSVQVSFSPEKADTSYSGMLTMLCTDTSRSVLRIPLSGSSYGLKRMAEFADDDPANILLYHFNRNLTIGDTLILDSSGKGFSGSVQGARWITDGLYGTDALYFAGDTGRVVVPSGDDLVFDMASEPFTLEVSFRTDTLTSGQALLQKGTQDSVLYGIFINPTGGITVSGFGSAGSALHDDKWHQVAFLYNPDGNSSLFVDGRELLVKRWIHSVATDRSRPLVIGAAETRRGHYGSHFQGAIDELRISGILRNAWEIQPPDYGIAVQKRTPSKPAAGDSITFQVQVPASLHASAVRVYHRMGGGADDYTASRAEFQTSIWKAVIPSSAVTLRGVEYYIEVTDAGGSKWTYPSLEPLRNPLAIAVYYQEMESGLTYHTQSALNESTGRTFTQNASLFSIPYALDDMSAENLLRDLMPRNPYEWRLFWWHPKRSQEQWEAGRTPVYLEFPQKDPVYFNVAPGRAFWLTAKEPRTFDIGPGRSVITDTLFSLTLVPGWNLIGCPYAFPVRWENCSNSSSELVNSLVSWDGKEYDYATESLEPWKGYWVHNPDTLPVRVFIPAVEAEKRQTFKAKASRLDIDAGMESAEWLVKIGVKSEKASDGYNYLGMRQGAGEGRDRFDRVESPPGFGPRVSLYFDHRDWPRYGALYTADIRPAGGEGAVWEFSLSSDPGTGSVNLEWSWIHALPEGWMAYLIDPDEQTALDLAAAHAKACPPVGPDGNPKTLRVVAGLPEFVREQAGDIPLVPAEFGLSQNYPNPFNSETRVQYGLPKKMDIRIVVYDVLGRRVQILHDGPQAAGYHQAVWDGRSSRGMQVASGVYVIQIAGQEKTLSRKMLLIK
jgi:hypothetical protein